MPSATVPPRASLPIVAPGPSPATDEGPGAGALAPSPAPPLTDADLVPLLTEFYARVARDPLLAPYFAEVDMREHIPRIADFWATILFQAGRYHGNAFRPHLAMPGLTAEHFARWLATLEATVDARHAGPAADAMKDYGHRIALSMQLRLGIAPRG